MLLRSWNRYLSDAAVSVAVLPKSTECFVDPHLKYVSFDTSVDSLYFLPYFGRDVWKNVQNCLVPGSFRERRHVSSADSSGNSIDATSLQPVSYNELVSTLKKVLYMKISCAMNCKWFGPYF